MNTDQAIAILQAERVLQVVGAGGPDIEGKSAWRDYVVQAGRVIQGDPLFRNEFNDLNLLKGLDLKTPSVDCCGFCSLDGNRCPNCGCEE